MSIRHFLSLMDLDRSELIAIIERATAMKKAPGTHGDILRNKSLGMIFEKSSTRTRVAFEVAMTQLGGNAIFLSPESTHLGRGEPIEDTARVLSRMVDCVSIRTYGHETLELFARYSSVPVINALTDKFHPCQLLADMQTWFEHRGDIRGKTVAWVGDGNNMCHSYINASALLDFELRIACPPGFEPDAQLLADNQTRVTLFHQASEAVKDADLVVTDVWASMGQEQEQQQRVEKFAAFQVTNELMSLADSSAMFMHCLPAHRGEEVSAEIIDHPECVVWEEAENRLHAQKALLEFLCAH